MHELVSYFPLVWFLVSALGKFLLARHARTLAGGSVWWRLVTVGWMFDSRWRIWGVALMVWLAAPFVIVGAWALTK